MTQETRTTIAPSDVVAVDIECAKCHQRVSRPINQWLTDFDSCPNCQTSWRSYREALRRVQEASGYMRLLSDESEQVPFKVRFEISEKVQL